jgi:hypothetical protein
MCCESRCEIGVSFGLLLQAGPGRLVISLWLRAELALASIHEA